MNESRSVPSPRVVALHIPGMTDSVYSFVPRESARSSAPSLRRPGPSFWLVQGAGWLAYAAAMTFSRVGTFPLSFMVVSKGALAVLGFLSSLVLWQIYRPLRSGEAPLSRIVVTSVAASYAMALVWSAASNLLDPALYGWLLDRRVDINSVGRLFSGSVYNAFTLLAWSLAYFVIRHQHALVDERERALRAEALAQEARLEALRLQINPHFLFNTLNAISTLVVERRSEEAARMIARLSDFLRLTLSGSSADEVTLGDELEFVARYLEIERVRFGDRLTTNFVIEDKARRVRVPVLILQPLVENAVRYAIVPREEGGRIELSARISNDKLHLTVCDDGNGVSPGHTSSSAESERRQIGLANTRERLAQLYGDRASFALRAGDTGGTVAEIIIPATHDAKGARIA